MEIKLIDGTFTIEEAEQLLRALFKVKIAFHERKISTIHQSEEDIKHSERRIIQLQNNLCHAIHALKQGGQASATLSATIEIEPSHQLFEANMPLAV
jgi:hypothetical protein